MTVDSRVGFDPMPVRRSRKYVLNDTQLNSTSPFIAEKSRQHDYYTLMEGVFLIIFLSLSKVFLPLDLDESICSIDASEAVNRCMFETPSLNEVLNRTGALLKSPSFKLITMN